MVFDKNDALVGMERLRVVAEFENQAHTAGLEYGYEPEKLERFMAVRGKMAEIAISVFGITEVEQISSELVEDIVTMASPEFQDKINKNDEERRTYKRLAEIDSLTGLGNQRAFDAAQATAENDENVSFIRLDADNFKEVNDSLGHPVGDEALKSMSRHIQEVADRYGFGERVFRPGGDEFVVLTSTGQAEEIKDEIVGTYGTEGMGTERFGSVDVSLSGGVGGTDAEADAELYKEKQAKKQNSAA